MKLSKIAHDHSAAVGQGGGADGLSGAIVGVLKKPKKNKQTKNKKKIRE